MKCIVTNDDGIDAPGLDVLTEIVRRFGESVVVAPLNPQSGVGHRVTTRRPIPVERRAANRIAVDGTPADCVRIALKVIAPDADWVFAGINPGANLGSDVYNSGTVAAVREAALLGCSALAISQYIARDAAIDWEMTGHHAASVLPDLVKRPLPEAHFWNVNLPHPLTDRSPRPVVVCDMDPHPHRYVYREEGESLVYEGTIHERPRAPGCDVAVCFGGRVSATCLPVQVKGIVASAE